MSFRYTPTKKIYAPNDPFFEEGNIELRAIWIGRHVESKEQIDIIRHEAKQLIEDYIRPIYCELEACLTDGMPLEFPSTAAYELHYETQHHNVCVVCSRIFPGSQWLHLHLDECHNVLKQMEKERGQNIYQCYVQGCQEKSAEPYLRRQHLIEQHQYPSYFPFNIVITGNLSFEERWRRDKGQEDMVEDSVMDEITSAMSRLTIPKSISFGQVEPSIWR